VFELLQMNKLNFKIPRSKKFLLFLVSFLIGCIFSFFLSPPRQVLYFALISFIVLIFLISDSKIFLLSLFFSSFILGVIFTQTYTIYFLKPINFGASEKRIIVYDLPIQKNKTQKIKAKDDEGKYLIYTDLYPLYNYGDELKISGNVEKPPSDLGFDYESYLERYGIQGIIYYPEISKIGENKGNVVIKYLIKLKISFVASIRKSMSYPESALSSAILIGNREDMPDSLNQNFKSVGLSHIVAVSGYNITIVIAIIWLILRYFGRKTAFILTSLISLLFVLLTGAESSIVRGAVIAEILLIARFLGRKPNSTIFIFLAAFLMVMLNPLILKSDIGFRLSFFAFIGLVYLSPLLQEKISSRIPEIIKNPLTETLSAQIFTLPILLTISKQISLFSILANILILPIIPLSMLVGFIQGIFGMISPLLGQILGWFNWMLMSYIINLSNFFASIKTLSFKFEFGIILSLIYYLILIFWIWRKNKIISNEKNKNT